MPWMIFCPVCDALVSLPHPHWMAFPMHFHGAKKIQPGTLLALGRMGWAAVLHVSPWSDPGWSTEADEEESPPELPVCPESQYRERAFDGPGRKEKRP